ncbi:hypothetical protein F4778DRAFT_782772 [Xylariomycetidae sp. FL2044]|nr:hypothetical protein F4778DRAFT_782772 [Xylariomycetidae sp. FL2044]
MTRHQMDRRGSESNGDGQPGEVNTPSHDPMASNLHRQHPASSDDHPKSSTPQPSPSSISAPQGEHWLDEYFVKGSQEIAAYCERFPLVADQSETLSTASMTSVESKPSQGHQPPVTPPNAYSQEHLEDNNDSNRSKQTGTGDYIRRMLQDHGKVAIERLRGENEVLKHKIEKMKRSPEVLRLVEENCGLQDQVIEEKRLNKRLGREIAQLKAHSELLDQAAQDATQGANEASKQTQEHGIMVYSFVTSVRDKLSMPAVQGKFDPLQELQNILHEVTDMVSKLSAYRDDKTALTVNLEETQSRLELIEGESAETIRNLRTELAATVPRSLIESEIAPLCMHFQTAMFKLQAKLKFVEKGIQKMAEDHSLRLKEKDLENLALFRKLEVLRDTAETLQTKLDSALHRSDAVDIKSKGDIKPQGHGSGHIEGQDSAEPIPRQARQDTAVSSFRTTGSGQASEEERMVQLETKLKKSEEDEKAWASHIGNLQEELREALASKEALRDQLMSMAAERSTD